MTGTKQKRKTKKLRQRSLNSQFDTLLIQPLSLWLNMFQLTIFNFSINCCCQVNANSISWVPGAWESIFEGDYSDGSNQKWSMKLVLLFLIRIVFVFYLWYASVGQDRMLTTYQRLNDASYMRLWITQPMIDIIVENSISATTTSKRYA